MEHNIRVHIWVVTSSFSIFPHISCFKKSSPASGAQSQGVSNPTSPFPALPLNSTSGGPCGSSLCQVAAPPLILLSQANRLTHPHKTIKSAANASRCSPVSQLPLSPLFWSWLLLINPGLNSQVSLYWHPVPRIRTHWFFLEGFLIWVPQRDLWLSFNLSLWHLSLPHMCHGKILLFPLRSRSGWES